MGPASLPKLGRAEGGVLSGDRKRSGADALGGPAGRLVGGLQSWRFFPGVLGPRGTKTPSPAVMHPSSTVPARCPLSKLCQKELSGRSHGFCRHLTVVIGGRPRTRQARRGPPLVQGSSEAEDSIDRACTIATIGSRGATSADRGSGPHRSQRPRRGARRTLDIRSARDAGNVAHGQDPDRRDGGARLTPCPTSLTPIKA